MKNNNDVIISVVPGVKGDIGTIKLNRPHALNALTTSMVFDVYEKLHTWQKDESIKAVVITGEGERSFCAGGDIKRFYDLRQENRELSSTFFWHEYRMNHEIFHCSKPYISLLHGITMGGGMGISIPGSHRIADEKTSIFAMPETAIGLHPDVGMGYFLSRCKNNLGFYLGLSGERFNAHDAKHLGIIDQVVLRSRFKDVIQRLAETPFSNDAHASVTKILNYFSCEAKESELIKNEKIINECFSANTLEEILNKLKLSDEFGKKVYQTLLTRSSTSLKVTFRQLKENRTMNFDQCLQLDYRLTTHCLTTHDFYEGIRAALIDKDRNPKWNPASLEEISDADVEKFFSPLEKELSF